MFNSGFLTLGSFAGAPIRFHWSVVILMLWFGRWHPGAWVGILVLVLMHELGHAMVVRAVRGQVTEVMVYGFGGYCAWRGNVSSRARAMIAWGGVWAQGVLLIAAVVLSPIINPAYDSFGFHLLRSLTTANIMLIVLNLIPVRPLDGAEAWPLVRMLWDDFLKWWAGLGQPKAQGGKVIRPEFKPKQEPSAKSPPPPKNEANGANGSHGTNGAGGFRVTDPQDADRLFKQVYSGLLPKDSKPKDPDDSGDN